METKNLFTLTLLKAINILDCFETDTMEIGIKEISQMIGMPQSSTYRIIQSLEFTGLIMQNKTNRKYRLGVKNLFHSQKVDGLRGYLEIAERHMHTLNRELNETVSLGIVDCNHVINLRRLESTHMLRPNYVVGRKYPIFSTALGKVFMSEMSQQALEWVYDQDKEVIGKTWEAFLAETETTRENGYAHDDEEFCPGLRCTAAPIYHRSGKLLFAVSVSTPTIRMDDDRYQKVTQSVVETCHKISNEFRGLE